MNQRSINQVAIGISILSLIVSTLALSLNWLQNKSDYDKSIMIQPGALPLTEINEGQVAFSLSIANTSKTNLKYFLRADTNMGCLTGTKERPLLLPCRYESQEISLSRADADNSSYEHRFHLEAVHGAVLTNPLAYYSEPKYFLRIEVIDASDGRLLYQSECFYAYHYDSKVFSLDQPVLDSTGESKIRQQQCRA